MGARAQSVRPDYPTRMQYTHDPHGEVLGRAPAFTVRHWRMQRPSLEPRTTPMQANRHRRSFARVAFLPAAKGVCELRCAWVQARRPTAWRTCVLAQCAVGHLDHEVTCHCRSGAVGSDHQRSSVTDPHRRFSFSTAPLGVRRHIETSTWGWSSSPYPRRI